MTPLRWYVDPAWRRTDLPHSAFLYPFWGGPKRDNVLLRPMLFDTYRFDTGEYSLTDRPEDADLIFMPYPHAIVRRSYPELIALCAAASKRYGLPLLVDGIEDIEHPTGLPDAFVLRYGGYRFEKTDRAIVVPTFANDLLERYAGGELRFREKVGKPVVGFAGWAKLPLYPALRALAKDFPNRVRGLTDERWNAKSKGVFWRARALRVLAASPKVTSNFIVRRSYSGHAGTAEKGIEQLQQEYVNVLVGSDYALDVRGDANASTRLFEALSLGRIPVILDTERNFPFSDQVDYSSFSLRVDFRDLARLPDRIADFHAALPPERFRQMQEAAREAYVRFFRVDALMRPLARELRQRISKVKA